MEPQPPATPSDIELRRAAGAFARPVAWRSIVQLVTSFGPFLAGCVAMHLAFGVSVWLTLALAIPTGALMVRVFIVQHDCGHGSFFASRRANALVGRLCSLCTLTPFLSWGRQHALHHAEWNNLDRSDRGSDIYSSCLTVRAYLDLSPRQRLLHRLVRHPLLANLVLPPLVFLLLYRVPFDTPQGWARERRSVHLTNAALLALFATLTLLLGWREVLLVHVPVVTVASILGVWLFTLQHRFPGARWSGRGSWRYVDAAMDGSSWFDLPPVLQWLTGNIGFHHVHHLNQRVPNYRLAAAHEAVQRLRVVPPLGLRAGLAAARLTLWDEARGRLVRFRDARA
ncbi:fatty acid desaturase [uncultured Reyranella sp.]|uniref:fatty acid desaturase family protein n=1 Tax=uncultured Reyranella sp. TaxID=735512 RepID=UPI00259D2049|nr:fatty acid desaturase [uncultured Reyranella sp.]